MSWSLASGVIIVSDDQSKPDSFLSEHKVLDATSTLLHYFGYGSNKRNLKAYLLNNPEHYNNLQTYYRTGMVATLTSDQGTEGNYYITQLNRTRVRDISRTKPVWLLSIELTAVSSGSF